MFVETIIGTKAKVKILRILSEKRTAYSLINLRDETELSLSIVHKSAEELAAEQILTHIKGAKKERLYKFNSESPFAASIFELFRIEKTRQRKEIIFAHTWSVLEDAVSKIKNNSHLIALFGSQARGDGTLRSDIDLLIVPKNTQENILGVLQNVKSKNKINPLIMNLDSFKKEINNNTLFYSNIKKDSIILHSDSEARKEASKFFEDTGHGEI